MAVTTTITNNALAVQLNAGVKPDGTTLVKTMNITGLKKTTISEEEKQKILNIVDALAPNLDYGVITTVLTTKATLEGD